MQHPAPPNLVAMTRLPPERTYAMLRTSLQSRPAAAGFTLIELIVVIVILGVLAAVALPRFTSLQGDARAAKANALAGSIRAAAVMAKSTALVKGTGCGVAVTMEGTAVTMTNCYPTADAAGIIVASNISAVNDNVGIAHAAGVTTIQMTGATTLATCQLTYTAPTVADNPPVVAVVTAGC